jgi:spore germination protein KC
MRRRVAALALAAVVSGLLQGCWNYREIESLNIVAGVAIDKGYEGKKFHLTVDIADTSNAGKDKPVITSLIETEGDTIFEAIRNAVKMTAYKLYFPNCQVVIIGKDVAAESIQPIVDWFMRDAEPRLTMELFVSQESTAKEILKQTSVTMAITSFEIDKVYELNEKTQPNAKYQTIYEIYNTLSSNEMALTLPAMDLAENMGETTCRLNGMAIFDKDRLVGFLTPEASQYAMFAMDDVKGGVLNVKAPTDNPIAGLEIYSNITRLTSTVEDGRLNVSIETDTEVAVNELDTTTDYLEKNKRGELESLAESQLSAEIGTVVQSVQSRYGKDIFGIGERLHRSDPDAWYALRQSWDEAFRNARVTVSCNIDIRNSSANSSSVKKEE